MSVAENIRKKIKQDYKESDQFSAKVFKYRPQIFDNEGMNANKSLTQIFFDYAHFNDFMTFFPDNR